MELCVLGPVRATVDGSEVPLGGPRQRRLLAALVIGGGRAVSIDRLVEAVWGGDPDPPSGASRSVLSYVSRLRSVLGSRCVTTQRGGYALAMSGVVDAVEFERLQSASRDASLRGAANLLEEALALWHGRAFGDLADEDWCRPAAVRLEELRLVALEARSQARLDLGEHAEVIPELERLVAEQPLRESFRAQLLLALFRCGRQADALRSFQEYRRLLGEETGLEPSRHLLELDRQIAVADPSLEFVTEGRTKRGYILTEVIGEGAFGTVYLGIQPAVGRDVAVKVVRPALADDPDFVRRFEGEARLVARLEHPHIVPLYDFWREPAGGAYLVMRYVRGGSLEDAMTATRPWPLVRVSRLVTEIGSALAVAHDAGVVHGDLTPANVLLDDSGYAYLTDFGIATDLTDTVVPRRDEQAARLYASPEQLRDGVATAQSDQYSLACLAWSLLARGQASDIEPQLPDRVAAVLRRASAAEPSARFGSMAELLACWTAAVAELAEAAGVPGLGTPLQGAAGVAVDARPVVANPYKGLRAFDEGDANDFFGRDSSVDGLLAIVHAQPLTLVVGPSGSGKSSLVRAGLVPRLRAEGWLVTTAVPGAAPLDELTDALVRVAVRPPPPDLRECLVDSVRLAETFASIVDGDGSDLVVVLDQLEELWTLADPAVRDRLLDALVAAATAPFSRLRIVATIRADFYDRPLAHPVIGALVERATYPIAPLTATELSEVMSGPARRVGIELEPALTAELTAAFAAQPASLPLLQYTLTELFDRRHGTTMTLTTYEAMGGLSGAMVSRAESIYADLDDRQRPTVRRLFRRLVTPGEGSQDMRRRARRSELIGIPPAIVDGYGAARLLTFDVDPVNREPTVEVAHEALIQHWPRLRSWVDEDREGLRVHRHLTAAASAWDVQGHDAAELYRGARLQAATEWVALHPEDLTPEESSFLAQSQRQARKAHRRALSAVAVLAVLLVAALVAAGLAVAQRRRADANAADAKKSAGVAGQKAGEASAAATREASARTDADLRRLAFEAEATAVSQPDLAMLLAVEAYRRQPSVLSEGALDAALVTQPAIRRFIDAKLPPDRTVRSMATSADLVAFELDGSVTLRDSATLQPTGVTIETGMRSLVTFNRSGTELATSTAAGEVRRWDPRTGREVAPVLHVQSAAAYNAQPPIAYLPDGSLAVGDGATLRLVSQEASTPERHVDMPGAAQLYAVDVSRSGGTIAVSWQPDGATDGALGLVDAASLSLRVVPSSIGTITSVRFATDGRVFVTAFEGDVSGDVALIDPDPAQTPITAPAVHLASGVTDLIALPDGGALAMLISGGLARIGADLRADPRIELRGTVPVAELADGTILGVASGRLVEVDPYQVGLIGHEVRYGGRRARGLLVGTKDRMLLRGEDGAMVVVDTTTLAPVSPPLVTSTALDAQQTVAMSAAGDRVAISSPAGVEVIDVAAGRALQPLLPFGTRQPATFSPDGHSILIAGLDGKAHVIDAATGAEHWARELTGEEVVDASWSDDGRLVTARTVFGDVHLLDPATGADVAPPLVGVPNVRFSPSGTKGVTAGTELRVIDARTGETVRAFPGTGGFWVAVFVRGERWISAMTGSGLDELFDVDSGTRIGVPLRVANDAISDLRRSVIVSNGLYWGSPDGPVVFYDLDPAHWADTACQAAGRNLTRAEWDQYLGSLGDYRATCAGYAAA